MDFEFVKTYGLSRDEEITLVNTYVEELLKSLEALKKSKEDKDIKLARVYSHKVQGSSIMVGLTLYATEAKEINSLVHKDQWNWENKLQNLFDTYPEVQRVANSFCS